ncbi:hypothetical protein J4438_01565 [Candidatus Woesearchaeota archaeon]|nr:hypothetical protein [Candidatus Woesearchaeota archaeon]
MINSKKGQSLSVNTIIIMILAIFVLIILVVAFTGGTGDFMNNIAQLWSGSGIDSQKAAVTCNGMCNTYNTAQSAKVKTDFCTKVFKIDYDGDKKVDEELTCPEMSSVSCPTIQC